MDCDKFEDIMLDELYGELDELTSAAAKRHMAGCARCAALLGGLRATRRVATLAPIAPSAGFEDRLLAAVREAEIQTKAPLGMAQLISLAGRWAMRPQTAMAAVFLLMVGTSSVLFSRRAPKSGADAAPASFTVTENGAPGAPSAPAAPSPKDEEAALDPQAAAAAHGPVNGMAKAAGPSPFLKTAPATSAPLAEGLLAQSDKPSAEDEREAPAKQQAYAMPHSLHAPSSSGGLAGAGSMKPSMNSQGADISPPVARAAADGFAVAPPPPPTAREADDAVSPLASARAERDSGAGCAVAAGAFDAVAASSWGTTAGYDATYEGAQCYARLGQVDAARSRFNRLLTVQAYAARAQAGINASSLVATKRKAAPKAAAVALDRAGTSTPPAAAAPPATPAAPPAQPASAPTEK